MIDKKNNILKSNNIKESVHHIFNEVTLKNSDKIAIIDEFGEMSYKELNHRSNQMSKVIRDLGVETGSSVLICLPQSRDYVISILGVLKAGGVYIPVDEYYPVGRVSYMMEDSGAQHMITTSNIATRFSSNKVNILAIDKITFENVNQKITIDKIDNMNDAACIIYTSGSTGLPKGIMLSHQSIVNLAKSASEHFELTSKDRFLQVASISFSAALEELYPPLLTGSTIVFQSTEGSLPSIDKIIEKMQDLEISVCEMVTPLWHEFVDRVFQDNISLPSTLRLIITGGERPLYDKYKKWLQHDINLIHVYGPTEYAATATYYHCSSRKDYSSYSFGSIDEWRLPIGKPIANTRLYILDTNLEEVETGKVGEIYISGGSLASYYVNKPSLTSEKFIPNPYSTRFGERMYKTGDLGRYLLDGNLEFIGRIDNQLKIRGYRVEPAEVEKALERYPKVKQAVVLGLKKDREELNLTAFIVGKKEELLSPNEWREYLLKLMPSYMIPSSFVYMDEIPLTHNGKIDRSELQNRSHSINNVKDEYIAPANKEEGELLSIWKEVFNTNKISCSDDFFDLGGHSLLALRIAARVRNQFEIEIQPDLILEKRNIINLAKAVKDRIFLKDDGVNKDLDDFNIGEIKQKRVLLNEAIEKRTGEKEASVISISQNGLWFLDQLMPASPLYNVPWKFKLTGNLDLSLLEEAINSVIKRQPALQSTFRTVAGQVVMVVDKSLSIPMSKHDLVNLSDSKRNIELERYLKSKAAEPFDLTFGPLIRAYVIKTKKYEHVVLINIHHIIFDGWSLELFMNELSHFYSSFLDEKNVDLPDLDYTYSDYAMWQRECIQNDKFLSGLSYWTSQLQDINHFLDLPYQPQKKKKPGFSGGLKKFKLGNELETSINRYSKDSKSTMYMILLASFKVLLLDLTKQSDIIVGAPAAGGRIIREFEQLVGYFVNTLVIRNHLNKEMKFCELLEQVKQTSLEAYKHQEVPLDIIAQKIKPKRRSGRNPLFQVDFLLEEDPLQKVNFSGLTVSELDDVSTGLSKFDLTWIIKKKEDGLYLDVNFNTDILSESDVSEMVNRFKEIVRVVIVNPQIEIKKLLTD